MCVFLSVILSIYLSLCQLLAPMDKYLNCNAKEQMNIVYLQQQKMVTCNHHVTKKWEI